MRSAWLAAVLSTAHVPCVHSRTDVPWPIVYPHGLSDPCAAGMYAEQSRAEFEGKPVVVVVRDVTDAKAAFQKFMSKHGLGRICPTAWEHMVDSTHQFTRDMATLLVHYEDLEDSKVVQRIGQHVGRDLSLAYIQHMQLLDIQQHRKCLVSPRSP